MDREYIVTRMTQDDVSVLINWAKREGGRSDGECFYQADPPGFFCGKFNGEIIAVGSAVVYNDQFAFCGFYIVDPKHRGQGYGLALTKEQLRYIGSRNAGLDAALTMTDKYARLGYQLVYNNARYYGESLTFTPSFNSAIIALNSEINSFLILWRN